MLHVHEQWPRHVVTLAAYEWTTCIDEQFSYEVSSPHTPKSDRHRPWEYRRYCSHTLLSEASSLIYVYSLLVTGSTLVSATVYHRLGIESICRDRADKQYNYVNTKKSFIKNGSIIISLYNNLLFIFECFPGQEDSLCCEKLPLIVHVLCGNICKMGLHTELLYAIIPACFLTFAVMLYSPTSPYIFNTC